MIFHLKNDDVQRKTVIYIPLPDQGTDWWHHEAFIQNFS